MECLNGKGGRQLMPRWPRLAILVRPMQKARLPSRGFRSFRQEFGNFFQVRHSSPTPLAGEQRRKPADTPPASKNVANWFPGPLKVQILFALFFTSLSRVAIPSVLAPQ